MLRSFSVRWFERSSALLLGLMAAVLSGGCEGEEGRRKNFDGPWVRHTIDDSLRGADGVRVADVNGDGLPDVVTGWEESGFSRAYLHPGTDAVRNPWPAVTVGATPNVEDAVWADIDGDGNMDVVSSLEGQARVVVVSFAPDDPTDFLDPAAWRTEEIPATRGRLWMYAMPMDVDGRHGIDLVIGGKRSEGMIGWLESPADPRQLADWKLHPISPAGWVMSIEAVDMNNDGLLDVLVSDRADSPVNGVHWFEHPSDPDALPDPWKAHPVGSGTRRPAFLAPVLDAGARVRGAVVPSGGSRLSLFRRLDDSGESWSEHKIPYPQRLGAPKAAAVGDIDLDGVPDVVVSCSNLSGRRDGVVWLPGAAEPLDEIPEKQGISGAQGEKFDRVELLDLDGDGDLDVLTTEEMQLFGVIWYENPLLSPDAD
jgi:hypothetical protein